MCGIAGAVSSQPLPERLLSDFTRALAHRGPDDSGTFLAPDRKSGLAHTRLSILDLSTAGHQPMGNADGVIWLSHNGEIYNFLELRRELERRGTTFRSRTDTEVLLKLYEAEGERCVNRLSGMFAFAILDLKRQKLLLARDRLGIKPLYFTERGGNFLFASEIKGLLAAGVPRAVDWQGIWDYFTFSFVPGPRTAFEGIRQLPPAHTLTLDLTTGRREIRRYWSPLASETEPLPSGPELTRRVREMVRTAVAEELVSDVPLGLFFSGGIDSTLLAAIVREVSPKPVKTFTVVFEGNPRFLHDDREYARFAARRLGTEHHELPVRLESPEEFLEMIRHVDQPFANSTLYLQYLIAQATRKHVTVALSGVGGDELFGGYPKYRLLPWAPLIGAIPAGLGGTATGLLRCFREDPAHPLLRRIRRTLRGAGLDLAGQYLRWAYGLNESEKQALWADWNRTEQPADSVRLIARIFSELPAGTDHYRKVFCAELETFLADNLLRYTDSATMAVALETRVPLLNHRLVKLSSRIRFRDKIRSGKTKRILIDAFRDLLPEAILRAPKRGFSPPQAAWMTQVLDQYFETTMTQKAVEEDGFFDWEAIQRFRGELKTGRRDSSGELLTLLMFDVWHRRQIRGAA
ncbi:MAG: asparagine synthase (glutamine-hydrolyzing) [Candidatus Omnitrophica bacterium CG11_big_fil_rev_8_21_14_0_20_64_10]|nr:MAG: asparagine synthase (glutamine-hydrolyzing) [Candidatus Omnitrophica bacterium CG11_big_fil_rev_8_21_14_0_20_64_10]